MSSDNMRNDGNYMNSMHELYDDDCVVSSSIGHRICMLRVIRRPSSAVAARPARVHYSFRVEPTDPSA